MFLLKLFTGRGLKKRELIELVSCRFLRPYGLIMLFATVPKAFVLLGIYPYCLALCTKLLARLLGSRLP